jgi:hypothetical protein
MTAIPTDLRKLILLSGSLGAEARVSSNRGVVRGAGLTISPPALSLHASHEASAPGEIVDLHNL